MVRIGLVCRTLSSHSPIASPINVENTQGTQGGKFLGLPVSCHFRLWERGAFRIVEMNA
jgi:hypothetical protein